MIIIHFFRFYQPPPSYSPYPQQPIVSTGYALSGVRYYNQTPLYPQQHVVIVSSYVPFRNNQISTIITSKLRAFLIISGLIGLICSLAVISLEVVIIIETYWVLYRTIWAGSFLFSGSICMLVAACRTSYPFGSLIKVFAFVLLFCIFGLVASAIGYNTSVKCSSKFSSEDLCDNGLVNASKLTIMIVFVVATVHTLINILVFTKEDEKTRPTSPVSSVRNY
jgi:hypothetical protein